MNRARRWGPIGVLLLASWALAVSVAPVEAADGPPGRRSSGFSLELPRLGPGSFTGGLEGPLTIDAGVLRAEAGGRVIVASGGVDARWGLRTLACESLRIDLDRRAGTAEGKGVLDGPEGRVEFARLEVDLEAASFVGVRVAGEDAERRFSFGAERIVRLGDGRLVVTDGWLTACRCPVGRPSWGILARKVSVTPGGRATFTRGWLQVKGRRVLPIPFGSVSLVDGRSTGFLFPEVRLGGSQPFQIGLPFFVSTSRRSDVTLTPTWVDTRGLKAGAEARWLWAPDQGGTFRFDYLHDTGLRDALREANPDLEINDLGRHGYDDDRFALSLRARAFPGPFSAGADLDLTRDELWYRDFRQDLEGRSAVYLPSDVWVTAARGPLVAGATGTLIRDLSEPRNQFALHRVPATFGEAVRLRPPVPGLSQLTLDLRADYGHYFGTPDLWDPGATWENLWGDAGRDGIARDRDEWTGADADGSEADGRYQQGEPVHRLDRLEGSAEVRGEFDAAGTLRFTPRAGVRAVLYDGYRDSEAPGHLAYPSFGFDLRTALFKDRTASPGAWSRHVIEPWLDFDAVPAVSEETHPLVSLDDRVRKHQRMTAGLAQRWLVRRAERVPGMAEIAQAVEVRLWQDVEAERSARLHPDRPFGPLRAAVAYVAERGSLAFRGAFDWYTPGFAYLAVDAGARSPEGNAVRAGFDWYAAQEAGEGLVYVDGDPFETLRRLSADRNEVAQLQLQGTWIPQTSFREEVRDPAGILGGFRLGARFRVNFADLHAVDRKRFLSQIYSVEYRSPCRCWSAAADVAVDADQDAPAVTLRLDLGAPRGP